MKLLFERHALYSGRWQQYLFDMGLLDWISRKEDSDDDIKQFCRLNGDGRVRQIMHWGDTPDNSKLKIFQYAILSDSDSGVKMAALKRIHLFQDKETVRQFLTNDKTKEIGQTCEPYYSMALSRTGLISKEEFEKRISG
jgi:hypothetical protein